MKESYLIKKRKKKNNNNGVPVFFYPKDILYGKTPVKLLFDPTISLEEKGLYGVYHAHCKIKYLRGNPFMFMSQEKIAKENAGTSACKVNRLTAKLKKAGWLAVIRRGQGKSGIVVLFGIKGIKLSDAQKQVYKDEVKKLIKQWNSQK